jgi:hypothetical protein
MQPGNFNKSTLKIKSDFICQSTVSGGFVEFVYFLIILVYCIMIVTESTFLSSTSVISAIQNKSLSSATTTIIFPFLKDYFGCYPTTVQLVPKTIASQKLENIAAEQTALLSLFFWEYPRPFKAYNRELITPSSQVLEAAKGHTLPHSYSSFDMNWKIRTTPKLTGKDTLNVGTTPSILLRPALLVCLE